VAWLKAAAESFVIKLPADGADRLVVTQP